MLKNVENRIKEYVAVSAVTDVYGQVTPELITMDGTEYAVSHAQPAKIGQVMRWRVCVKGKETHLYYENPRWYVMRKVYAGECRHPHSPEW